MIKNNISIYSNKLKSVKGSSFNKIIGDILKYHLDNNHIEYFKKEPKYSAPGYTKTQFNPDYEIQLLNGKKIVIDNTTSIRSDRVKQKQWDALGVKSYFKKYGENINYYIVIPNSYSLGTEYTNKEEVNLYLTQRLYILENEHYSEIDDIIELDELEFLIMSTYLSLS